MGWSFSCDVNYTIADQLADFRTPGKHFSARFKILRSVRVGNKHWALLEDNETGRQHVTLDLMKGPSKKAGDGAGYKGMSEDMGPYHFDCPLSIIDNAKAPESEFAYNWRQKVRAHHAAKKARAKVVAVGSKVVYGGNTYELVESLGRKGWRVRSEHGGVYRMGSRLVAQSTLAAAS